ncbi:hypothetical protein [Mycolicibacterium fortuitum]
MTFPSGPSGSGFPEQPDFSQQPSFGVQPPIFSHQPGFGQQPPGYPQQPGYPGSLQPAPPSGPSSATAITAGILALLGGLVGIVLGSGGTFAIFISGQEERDARMFSLPLIGFGFGLVLLIGAISLFRRSTYGRRLIVIGCAMVILFAIIGLADVVFGISDSPRSDFDSIDTFLIAGLFFPVLTLVMTLLPSTACWIEAKPSPVAAQYYPPYQR